MNAPESSALRTELESMLSNELLAGIAGRDGLVDKFQRHAELTLEANQRLNLTSITEPREVALKHFLDSLAPHSLLDDGESILDLGSGAGYPGIPLAESTLKKARFLQEVATELALPSIEVLGERGEEILRRARVDTVLVRAIGPAERILKLLERVSSSFHRLLLYKGPDPAKEIAEAEPVARSMKLTANIVLAYELPGGTGSRSIIEYRHS